MNSKYSPISSIYTIRKNLEHCANTKVILLFLLRHDNLPTSICKRVTRYQTAKRHLISAWNTVNSEIFAKILLWRKALKVIFATLKIRDYGMIYPYIVSVNDRVIVQKREEFIFTKFLICEVSRK